MFETLPDSSGNLPPTPLARALEQNETALDSVGQSATELVVVHAVLTHEIPHDLQTGEVAQALQRTDELEIKISDAALEMAEVNEVLSQEIDERVDLERELAETKAELVQARRELA